MYWNMNKYRKNWDTYILKCCWVDGLNHQYKSHIDVFEKILTYFDLISLEEGYQYSATDTIVVICKIKIVLYFEEINEEMTKEDQRFSYFQNKSYWTRFFTTIYLPVPIYTYNQTLDGTSIHTTHYSFDGKVWDWGWYHYS